MKRFMKIACLVCILSLCAACGGTENAEGSHGKEAPAFTDSLTKDGTGIARQAEAAADMVEYYKNRYIELEEDFADIRWYDGSKMNRHRKTVLRDVYPTSLIMKKLFFPRSLRRSFRRS